MLTTDTLLPTFKKNRLYLIPILQEVPNSAPDLKAEILNVAKYKLATIYNYPLNVVDSELNNNSFRFYPNPVIEKVTMLASKTIFKGFYSIASIDGKVHQGSQNISGDSFEIDMSKFSAGLYIVTIFDGTQFHRMKLIKN
jgi:hypothetical protein